MPSVEEIFAPVYGKQAWNVEAVSSSFLSFEFGEKHLWTRDSRVAAPDGSGPADPQENSRIYTFHGTFHLWFYRCDWRVVSGDAVIGDSSSERAIKRAASRLEGYRLKRVTVSPDGTCLFQFDRYHRLVTKPHDANGEQWFLYDTSSSQVLTCYGDGRLDYQRNENCYEEGDKLIVAARQAEGALGAAGAGRNRGR